MKVLVVDDHALVREGLLGTLKGLRRGVKVIGASDAPAAMAILEQNRIDLILLDLMLPGTSGQSFLPVVRRRFPDVPVVVLSAQDDANTVAAVVAEDAAGFISKSASSAELLATLSGVLEGEAFVPSKMVQRSARAKAQDDGPLAQHFGLTTAQERVLHHLVDGASNRQIADVLGIAEGTVKIHVSAIMKALKVNNRAEAALVARRVSAELA